MFDFSKIGWLDDKGHIKPPTTLFILLAFLARAWVIFAASLTQHNQRDGLIKLFYPQSTDFVMALITGSSAVFIYLLVIAERKRKLNWVIPVFSRLKWFLFSAIIFESVVLWSRLSHLDFQFSWSYGVEVIGLFWGFLYVLKSQHLKRYVIDWAKEVNL
ncbi:MAG: DUF2919 domain-containing protein [Parashewanella sp.]